MKTCNIFRWQGVGGIRISRLRPRGDYFKTCPFFEDLAPPWPVIEQKYPFSVYKVAYQEWCLLKLHPEVTWVQLHSLVMPYEPVLLSYHELPFSEHRYDHRRLVADWLSEAIGEPINEISYNQGVAVQAEASSRSGGVQLC